MRLRTVWPWMACAALHVVCGDNLGSAPDAAVAPDAGGPAPDAGSPAIGFVVAGDYTSTGIASIIALPEIAVTRDVVSGVASSDLVVRYQDGRIYVVNRLGRDNVTVLDAGDYQLIAQISTGAGSNPQDVAARGNTLYVAALNRPGILVLDLERPGDGVIQTIDLSALDPGDGIPDCNSVYLVEDTLYATCGALAGFQPVTSGNVAMIDATSNTFTGAIDLETRNPVGFLHAAPADSALAGDLLVATVDYGHLSPISPAARAACRRATSFVFRLAGGRRVIMRPSGTEPKLKSYYEVRVVVGADEDLAAARARGLTELAALRDGHQARLKAALA